LQGACLLFNNRLVLQKHEIELQFFEGISLLRDGRALGDFNHSKD
jgi:hypothetical protein